MSDFLKTYEILNNATKFDKDLPNLAKQTKQYSSFIQTDRNQGHDLMQFSCKSCGTKPQNTNLAMIGHAK